MNSIDLFIEKLNAVITVLERKYCFELVFVNDGSTDATERAIMNYASQLSWISLINLSRNFGKEAALSAGIKHARGDAVIPMDVDLQDPPEIIEQMLIHWQEGAKVVNARRASRDQDSWLKRTSAAAFYKIFNFLADRPIPFGVGDFRLLDREVVDAIMTLGERSRFNKELFNWVGFETIEISYERPARSAGVTHWSYWKLWKLACDGIFASTTIPLRIWTYIGLIMTVVSIFYSGFLFFRTLLLGVDTPGYASTAILILIFGGMNMFALGIIGEYVGRIYTEVRQRPLYIVRSVYQHSETDT
ncbi:MAG: glycosyltransferase family 2 protein [Desulfobulbaceae bacterium]|nr:glycosyltransferase family 2 protein [Desulfobulbaceae bacterium]